LKSLMIDVFFSSKIAFLHNIYSIKKNQLNDYKENNV